MGRDGSFDRSVLGVLSLHEGRPVSEDDIRSSLRIAGKDPDRMVTVLRALQHRGLIVKVIDDAGTSWMLPRGGFDLALSQLRGS